MSKTSPTIEDSMTALPHSIGDEQTLAKAAQIMSERKIRHLPVLRGGKLLGILTDRDVHLIQSLPGVNPETLPVSEAMTEEPYTVAPGTRLSEVAQEMAANKYGSAVVIQQHKVVGIFTAVDACRTLSELLRSSAE
jgi:acetoin utilization protein AcuB